MDEVAHEFKITVPFRILMKNLLTILSRLFCISSYMVRCIVNTVFIS